MDAVGGPDIARIGLRGNAVDLCAWVGDDLSALDVTGCPLLAPAVDLVVAMREGDKGRLAATAGVAEQVGNVPLAAFASEEAACAAAAAGDRDGAREHVEAALGHFPAWVPSPTPIGRWHGCAHSAYGAGHAPHRDQRSRQPHPDRTARRRDGRRRHDESADRRATVMAPTALVSGYGVYGLHNHSRARSA